MATVPLSSTEGRSSRRPERRLYISASLVPASHKTSTCFFYFFFMKLMRGDKPKTNAVRWARRSTVARASVWFATKVGRKKVTDIMLAGSRGRLPSRPKRDYSQAFARAPDEPREQQASPRRKEEDLSEQFVKSPRKVGRKTNFTPRARSVHKRRRIDRNRQVE